MMRITALLWAFFVIFNVNAMENNNLNDPATPKKKNNNVAIVMPQNENNNLNDHAAITIPLYPQDTNNVEQPLLNTLNANVCIPNDNNDQGETMSCQKKLHVLLRFVLTVINVVLPGLLLLKDGYIMAIIHFMFHGSKYFMVSIPMLIANSVLVHQYQHKYQPIVLFLETEGKIEQLAIDYQTVAMLSLPAIAEGLRFLRNTSNKQHKRDPFTILLSFANSIMPAFVFFGDKFFDEGGIAFYFYSNLSTPLLFFSLFQFESETIWLLFLANLFTLILVCNPVIDTSQIVGMVVLFVLRMLLEWFWNKYESTIRKYNFLK